MIKRIAVVVWLVALCALAILRVARPPRPVPATAHDTSFSAERALRHVRAIAQRPHPMGSVDHDRVRDYIIGQLAAIGLRAELQRTTAIGTRYQEAGRVQNILARLQGSDRSGKAVLLMAHYDGVEAGPGAADDGSGCAAMLETLRALRASKKPLAHDVIALFTDGEEAGLLGSAAFVREHPWAKDVAVVLNFDARGTSGRSLMFETGPGNLDVARAFRSARYPTGGSVYATIYRALPNDTDLSELAPLGLPALNFAFADGVELYHTSHDDVKHLDPASVQHQGSNMLEMARTFASEPLPRPRTGDGVFFDLPVIGLVVYPISLELPLAILALVLVAVLVVRGRTGSDPLPASRFPLPAFATTLVVVAISVAIAVIASALLHGPAIWSGWYAAGVAFITLSATLVVSSLARRWSTARGIHIGALVVWALLALALSILLPGVAYLFTWPLLFTAGAALIVRGREAAEWIAAAVTLLILAGLIYALPVVMLGVTRGGAIGLCVMTALVAMLLSPMLDVVAGDSRWSAAGWIAGAGIACIVFAALTVHPTPDHPLRSSIVYAENADSSDAWLGTFGHPANNWMRAATGADISRHLPQWTTRLSGYSVPFTGHQVPRARLDAPNVVLTSDSTSANTRRIVLRASGPAGTIALTMRATGAPVLESSIDGRAVDTSRYRDRTHDWTMQFWAVPDSGATLGLTIPANGHLDFSVGARRSGIPSIAGVSIPPRPPYVVASQTGDATIVYREFHF
ncbi:MAG: M20/M25/M40 family metallo-hydrolase [Gemmatimonadaceae bacterium]